VEARTVVGTLMMLVLPVGLVGGALIGDNGYREVGGLMFAIGFLLGIPFAFVGYRVMRGGMEVGDLPGFFLVLAVFLVGVFVVANCPTQIPR